MPCDVLLVEDDVSTRDALRDVLEEYGLSVRTADHGNVALRIMRETRPKAVMVDLMMPVMNGWKFLETVSESPELRDIPLIMMTASSTPRPAGCYRLLKKPFREGEIEHALEPFVGELHARQTILPLAKPVEH